MPLAGSASSAQPPADHQCLLSTLPTLCPGAQAAGRRLRRWWDHARLHLALRTPARIAPASDAWPLTSALSSVTHSRLVLRLSPSSLSGPGLQLLRPLLTSRSGLHRRPFRHKARSPQVRTHSFITQPPDLRRLILDHKSFTVSCPLALIGTTFYLVLVHRLMIYAPRFLPTLGHPHAVALHFAHCGQLAAGLAPTGVRPCWAHKKRHPITEVPSLKPII